MQEYASSRHACDTKYIPWIFTWCRGIPLVHLITRVNRHWIRIWHVTNLNRFPAGINHRTCLDMSKCASLPAFRTLNATNNYLAEIWNQPLSTSFHYFLTLHFLSTVDSSFFFFLFGVVSILGREQAWHSPFYHFS